MRLIVILALLLVTAGAVSWVAKIDIVAPTRGEVVARERTREVHALEAGVVAALHVDEGARVRKGMLLVELDDTTVGSEIRRLEAELIAVHHTTRRLRLLESGAPNGEPGEAVSNVPPGAHLPGEAVERGWELHLRLGDLERRRLAAGLDEANRRVETARSRVAVIAAERRLVDRLIPVVREQADGLAALSARAHASRHDYLRELVRHIELEGRAESLGLDIRREEQEIARLRSAAHRLRLDHDASRQRELVEADLQVATLRENLVQARRRHLRHRIAAPIDGVVQDVGALAEGSFVRQGDPLMSVVPAGGGLEIRAYVLNRDVGFVKAGQEAIVKIDAFPFTRYGTAEGVVEGVSLDAVGVSGSPSTAAAGAGEYGAGYLVRIALTRPVIEIDGIVVPLRPGMQATVDIRTGRRRMLEYVIAPLVSYGSNAFRER